MIYKTRSKHWTRPATNPQLPETTNSIFGRSKYQTIVMQFHLHNTLQSYKLITDINKKKRQ